MSCSPQRYPWVARAVFQILATYRATGGAESPVDFPSSASEGGGVIARPGRIVGYTEVVVGFQALAGKQVRIMPAVYGATRCEAL